MADSKKKKRDRKKTRDGVAAESRPLPFEETLERGDYATTRRLALAALDGPEAARARAAFDRIKVDRIPLAVLGGGLLLISIVAYCGLG